MGVLRWICRNPVMPLVVDASEASTSRRSTSRSVRRMSTERTRRRDACRYDRPGRAAARGHLGREYGRFARPLDIVLVVVDGVVVLVYRRRRRLRLNAGSGRDGNSGLEDSPGICESPTSSREAGLTRLARESARTRMWSPSVCDGRPQTDTGKIEALLLREHENRFGRLPIHTKRIGRAGPGRR